MNRKKPRRRSPCPVACALDVLGDRWTLLIIRDLYFGSTRFKEFSASPEGIPTNVLSDRLARLLQAGILEQCLSVDGSSYKSYRLTESGKDLFPVLKAVRDWGLKWQKGTHIDDEVQ